MPARLQKLTFLGTCSGVPTKMRNMSGAVLSLDSGAVWLYDCGEGTQHQLLRSSVSTTKITKIFITHMHGDHCYGLPGLLCSMGMGGGDKAGDAEDDDEMEGGPELPTVCCRDAPETAPASTRVVDIHGPLGLGSFIRTALRLSHAFLPYRYRVHEAIPFGTSPADLERSLQEVAHPNELRPRHMQPSAALCYDVISFGPDLPMVQAAVLRHVPGVFCIGYAMTEPPRPGKLDAKRLKELGVAPGPEFGALKGGRSVTLADGRQIHPADVLGPEQRGRKVVILGDTCDSGNMLAIGRGADILVHESTFSDESAHLAGPRGHSTARMAGDFAKQLAARQLVLTHFSARFAQSTPKTTADDQPPTVEEQRQAELAAQAAAVQPLVDQARQAFCSDRVIAAHDFLELPIVGSDTE